jgi:hypothetical protein
MSPKEKAMELFDKYYNAIVEHWDAGTVSKQCALIAVDEIISAIGFSVMDEYWQEVKEEIEKL